MKNVILLVWHGRPSIPEFVAAFLGTFVFAAIMTAFAAQQPALALSPRWFLAACSLPTTLFFAIWIITALASDDGDRTII